MTKPPLTKPKTATLPTWTRAAAVTASVIAFPLAAAAIGVGDTLATDEAAIRAALEAEGYAIQEIEREGREIEVEATRDGREFELTLSAETGLVIEIELEDDDEDDD